MGISLLSVREPYLFLFDVLPCSHPLQFRKNLKDFLWCYIVKKEHLKRVKTVAIVSSKTLDTVDTFEYLTGQ